MITKVINVNLHQPIYEKLTAKQGDIASRYLLFHLLDGDKPFDLTGKSVRVYAIKPDKTEIFNDLTINDASKGYCTLELTSQCLASAGVVKMELYISQSGKVLTSIPFELEVIACINTVNSVTSTNEFSALEVALGSLQDYDNLRREIVQARKGYTTVGKRLDNFDSQLNNFDSQLDEKANENELNLLSFYRYGEIVLPSDFYNNINFRMYRSVDGKINHNFNIDDAINGWRTIYISEDGNDANNGDTQDKPKKTLNSVFDKINAISENDVIIKILSPLLTRNNSNISTADRIINKNIAIVSDTETNIGSIESPLSWIKNGACYQTTRSAVSDVWDKKNRDFANKPIQYKKVSSLTECQNTKGSWCLEGTTLYVRRLDDLAIDEDIMVLLQTGSLMFDLQSDVKLIFKNVNFLCTHDLNPNVKIYSATNKGQFIGVNSNFLGSQTMNGLQIENIKHSWLFNCGAIGTMRDGFNYHNFLGNGENSFAFEFNCVGYNNGVRDSNPSNNATTAHDGYRILRIGDIGFNTRGPVLADVNASYSINYDCTMYDSILTGTPSTKTAYWFDDLGVTEKTTQAYLINCSGGGKETKGINTDGIAKVNVHNFKGNNVNTSVLNYLE